MAIETKPLSPSVGLEVFGVDASRPIDPDTRSVLLRHFIDAGVLLFRGAGNSTEAHVHLSRCFGELERHSSKEAWTDGFPELIDISYRPPAKGALPDLQPIYEVDGEALAGWLPWHTDQCFMPRLSRGGVLRALQVPPTHGRTGFLDKIHLYDTLDDDLKAKIEGLSVVYRFDPRMDRNRFGNPPGLKLLSTSAGMNSMLARLDRDFPPAVHPLVYAQAETGRKVLNFSPCYATAIQGMSDGEGDAILSDLADHVGKPHHAYYHSWRADDLVVWDNWRTLHSAEGCPARDTRIMHRTSIAGDYGLGAALN